MSPLGPPTGDGTPPGTPPPPKKPQPSWAPKPASAQPPAPAPAPAPNPAPAAPPAAASPGPPAPALPERMKANKAVAGKVCPGCKNAIALGADVWNCPACGTPHHQMCRDQGGGCLSDACSAKEDATAAPGAETKACPFCGETVLKSAKKCKHCREILSPALRAAREKSGAASGGKIGRDALIFGILGLVICGPLGIVAIIKGKEAQKYPDQAGLGMAGMIIGIIACLIMLLSLGAIVLGAMAGN
jgi:predicted RNA-binding Zn-ribbon protein involved in translation (DUF1610 family)